MKYSIYSCRIKLLFLPRSKRETSMLISQRLKMIRELFLQNEIMDIPTLSQLTGVSEITIRRDLERLEAEGFVERTYGGAILKNNITQMRSASFSEYSEGEDVESLRLIGRIAANLLENYDTIFLGGDIASVYMAKSIQPDINLTVITNNIFVVNELWNKPGVKVTVTGGDILQDTGSLVGRIVNNVLDSVFVKKAFVGVKGVDIENGFSMGSIEECEIVKHVIERSSYQYALADHTKFDTVSFAKLGDIDLFQAMITNKEVNEKYKIHFYDHHIKLYETFDIQ